MTTRELAHDAPTAPYKAPTSYSEIIRDEVKAECGRRGVSQRRLSLAMGLSQQSISERWRGRVPWTLDEVERLETVLGLARGALLFRCARRDSNPQPSDLSPLQVLLGISASTDVELWDIDDEDDYRRGQCVICSGDCEPGRCIMFSDLAGLPVFDASASADCFECLEAWCSGGHACACVCHDAGVVTPAAVWELAA